MSKGKSEHKMEFVEGNNWVFHQLEKLSDGKDANKNTAKPGPLEGHCCLLQEAWSS